MSDDFESASAFVAAAGAGALPQSLQLRLYGFYKIATAVPGSELPQPGGGLLSSFGRDGAKRGAWEAAARALASVPLRAGETLAATARAAYVDALDEALPAWRSGAQGGGEDGSDGDEEDNAAVGVYVLSRPLAAPEPVGDALEALKGDLHYCAAKGLAAELAAALRTLGPAAAAAAANAPLEPSGETLLHVAADAGCGAAVAVLLVAGAAADAREPAGGQTALHYACALGRWDAAAALLRGGADPALRDAGGCSAEDVADEGLPLELRAALRLRGDDGGVT
jgi:hypothetical protein